MAKAPMSKTDDAAVEEKDAPEGPILDLSDGLDTQAVDLRDVPDDWANTA